MHRIRCLRVQSRLLTHNRLVCHNKLLPRCRFFSDDVSKQSSKQFPTQSSKQPDNSSANKENTDQTSEDISSHENFSHSSKAPINKSSKQPTRQSNQLLRWWLILSGLIVSGVAAKRIHREWTTDKSPLPNPLEIKPVTQVIDHPIQVEEEVESDELTWCRLARQAQSIAFQLQLQNATSDSTNHQSNFQLQPVNPSITMNDVTVMFDRLDDVLRPILSDITRHIVNQSISPRVPQSIASLYEDPNIELFIDVCLNPLLRLPTRCLALRILDKISQSNRAPHIDENKPFAHHPIHYAMSDHIVDLASNKELIAFACQFKCIPHHSTNDEPINQSDGSSLSDSLFEAHRRRLERSKDHSPASRFRKSISRSINQLTNDPESVACSPELQSLLDSLGHLKSLTDYLHVYLEQQPDQSIDDKTSRSGPDSLPSLHPSIIEEDLALIPESAINHSLNHAVKQSKSDTQLNDETSLSYVMGYIRSGASVAVATVWGEKNQSIYQLIKQRDFQALRLLASLCDQRDVCEHLVDNRLIEHVSLFMERELSQPGNRAFTQSINQSINQSNHQLRLSVQCARLMANILQHSDSDFVDEIIQKPLLMRLIDWSHANPLDPSPNQSVSQAAKPLEQFPTLVNRLAIKSQKKRQAWFQSIKEKLPDPVRSRLRSMQHPDHSNNQAMHDTTNQSSNQSIPQSSDQPASQSSSSSNDPSSSQPPDVDDEPYTEGSETAASLLSARHSQSIRVITNLAAQIENRLIDRISENQSINQSTRQSIKYDNQSVDRSLTQSLNQSIKQSVTPFPILCDEVYMLHPSLRLLPPVDQSIHQPGNQSLTAPLNQSVDPSEPLIDIVFVHGLLGNPIRTWRLHTDHDHPLTSIGPSDEQLVDLSASGDALDELVLWSQQRMKRFMEPINQSINHAMSPHGVPGTESNNQSNNQSINQSKNPSVEDPLEIIWPRDWLPYDLPVPVRILSIGFRSALLQKSINQSVNQRGSPLVRRASEFESKLASARVGADGRTVVFVTHSMGGLLAKQMLCSAMDQSINQSIPNPVGDNPVGDNPSINQSSSLLDSTTGLIFMATPHAGAWLPKLSRPRALVGYLATPSIELDELERGSAALKAINQSIKKLVHEKQIDVLSFGETLATPLPPNRPSSLLSILLVPPESSNPGYGKFQLIEEDHLNVCKPHDKNSQLYVQIKEFLIKQAKIALDRKTQKRRE